MLNEIIIMGRFTADPELKHTPSNTAVTAFSLAVQRDYKGSNGERETDFIDCVAWRNTAEYITKYFAKGRLVVVVGHLQTRTYESKGGEKHKVTEIIVNNAYFADSKKDGSSSGGNNPFAAFEEMDEDEGGSLPF